MGQTSGMVAAQQSDFNDVYLTDDEMSWVASASNVSTVLGMALAALVTENLGRRRALTVLSVPVVICWIIIFFGQQMWVYMTARIILGTSFGGVLSLCVLTTAEYTAPKIRGFYLNMIITAGVAVGASIANILGTIIHWRTVTILGVIPATLSAVLPFFWVESPTWLASKGRFDECASAFRTLHGARPGAEAELQLLIKLETQKQNLIGGASESAALIIKKITTALKQKYMWKIACMCVVLHLVRVASGRGIHITFVNTILQNITGKSDVFLFSLLADGCLILGSFLSCILMDRMKVRTLLFSGGIAAFMVLIALSFSLYYYKNAWLNCSLLALFTIIVSAGPYPVMESLFGEIYPLEIKCYCMFGFGIIGTVVLFLSIKLAMPMFALMGYHGVFLFNAGLGLLCLTYLWFYLPETKGRTLQEIELYFKNNRFDDINDLIKEEQITGLL